MIDRTDLSSPAFRYSLLKWPVFPLALGANIPIKGSHGHKDASADPDVTRARWLDRPHQNIGIATGADAGFFALDVDPRHDGIETMRRLVDANGALPTTVTSRTPSGGWHLFFQMPGDGRDIRNSAGQVGDGVDVRATGGYICAPPSWREDGCYRWVRSPHDHEIVPAPSWLLGIICKPSTPPGVMPWYNPDLEIPEVFRRQPETLQPAPTMPTDIANYVSAAVDSELDELRGATTGTRNTALNKCAFAVFGFAKAGAVPVDWARATLTHVALNIGLGSLETAKTLTSAWSAAPERKLDD